MQRNWIEHPTTLIGEKIVLLPLEKEFFDELWLAASDTRIWEFLNLNGAVKETFLHFCQEALLEREKGNQYPFVVRERKSGKLIGSTRFIDIQAQHKKLEIGWTWLHPDYWGTVVNFECKYLLLSFCFENLKTNRVQIKTSDNNLRSRKAIEKIGGQFEGILRKDMIRENGSIRNSAYYSIIDEEWKQAKKKILDQLASKNKN